MHPLLEHLLSKRGIKEIRELQPEERETFQAWQAVLSGHEEVTVDAIKAFCEGQLKNILSQLRNLDNSIQKNERLIMLQNVYGLLLDILSAPKAERERLEKHLTTLLDTP